MITRNLLGLLLACNLSIAHGIELISKEGKWTFNDQVYVPTLLDPFDPASEQIGLPANIFIPTSDDPAQTFPAVIFVSSWGINEYEYLDQAQNLAEQGYVVLSYTARGFWSSPGLISTAGEADVNDCRNAIDYLIDPSNHLPVDPDKIGMGGISYGAGITLLTSMVDERVKAVVAMSGWGDLVESLWAGNTPNFTWLEILTLSSQPIPFIARNQPDPLIAQYYGYMREHTNIDEVKAWGYIRSPIEYVGFANARENKPAIFTSNNLHDYLFQPNSIIRMLKQYNGPWRALFNTGVHATAEAGGLLGADSNRVWNNVHLWLDHYLKGIDNGIEERKRVNTVVIKGNRYESFDSFDMHDANKRFSLNPVAGARGGLLSEESGPDFESVLDFDTTNRVTSSGWVTGALSASDYLLHMDRIDPANGLVFNSAVLEQPIRLRGSAQVSFWAYARDKAQYFAYLYFLDAETGVARWVGHAPFTCHVSEGCGLNPDEPNRLTLDFYWTSVNLPIDSQLLLIIDGKDEDYWRYPETPEQNTVIISPQYPAELVMPVVTVPAPYDDPDPAPEEDTNSIARGANGIGTGAGSSGGSTGLHLLIPLLLAGLLRRKFV